MRNSEWTFLLQPTVFFSYMDKSAVQKIRVILIGFRGVEGWLNFICCFVWFQKFSTLEAASTLKTGTSSVHVHYDRVQQREYIVVLYEKLSHRMEVVFVSTTHHPIGPCWHAYSWGWARDGGGNRNCSGAVRCYEAQKAHNAQHPYQQPRVEEAKYM